MRRGISNKAALVASLSTNAQTKAIEQAGGAWAYDQPNRETRRRMQQEEKRQAKKERKHVYYT